MRSRRALRSYGLCLCLAACGGKSTVRVEARPSEDAAGEAGAGPTKEAPGTAGAGPSEDAAGAAGTLALGGAAAGSPPDAPDSGQCDTDRDCFIDNACSRVTCVAAHCMIGPRDAGTVCKSDEGGRICDGSANCVACLTSADCADGTCVERQCLPFSCSNGFQDGDETDLDCGGTCPACLQMPPP